MLDMQISLQKKNIFLQLYHGTTCIYVCIFYFIAAAWALRKTKRALINLSKKAERNLFKNDLQTEYNSFYLLFLADHFLILTYHILYVSKLSIQCQRKTQLWHIDMLIVSLETDCNWLHISLILCSIFQFSFSLTLLLHNVAF